MAITDRASLADAVARWAGGSSDDLFADAVSDAITLAETDLNDLLRVPEMVKRSTFAATAEFEALPADCARVISLGRLVDGKEQPLGQVGEQALTYYVRGYQGAPIVYALVGVQMRFAPAPSTASPMAARLTYYGNVPPLSATAPCTAVLLRYPNTYLYGALKHVAHYTEDDAKQAKWSALQIQEIQKANRAGMLRDATLAA